jgi:D-alanyl-D-alanine carboxypeptidase/D-alanyl-D-alanine-endopeptidase (penicillin-binding protein 4)
MPELVLENGSGLSRSERISARSMARLLASAIGSPWAPDFVASLPVASVDGTMQNRLVGRPGAGFAYLKTGALEGVRAVAGYLFDVDGRRFTIVCFVNHPNAAAANPPLDFLVQWLYVNAGAWERLVEARLR